MDGPKAGSRRVSRSLRLVSTQNVLYQPPLKPTLGRIVPVMPAQTGIHGFSRVDTASHGWRAYTHHDGE